MNMKEQQTVTNLTPEERLELALQEQVSLLEREIDNINNRQIEIQSIISDITNDISYLNDALRNIEDPSVKYKFYSAVNSKMELLSNFYSIFSSFEDTKFRYIQNRGDSNLKFLRQLHIDLVKVSKELDSTSTFASELLNQLNIIAKTSFISSEKNNFNNSLSNNSDDVSNIPSIPESIRKELVFTNECKL